MIDLLLRRRMMAIKSNGGSSAVVSGTMTLESDASSFTLTHNLNSNHYIVGARMVNPTFGTNGAIGGVVHNGISFNYQSNHYTASSSCFETRTTQDSYSDLFMGNSPSDTQANALPNSCNFYVRNGSYPFLAGTYQWVAIDLEKTADFSESMVLESDTNPITVTHNLDNLDVMIYVEANTPTYNVTGEVAMMYFGKFFEGMNYKTNHYQYIYMGYETRDTTAFADNAQLFTPNSDNSSTTRAVNAVQMKGRGSNYYFRAGTFGVKTYVMPTFN